jgi:UDP-N-acetylmuramoyl-L-alanyl-D-glutamate--2,6-diaminopimelate ligase
VEGLTFALGLLTNLVPDEHLEYHPTPEHYLRTKARFFDHLEPGAPVVANADDAYVIAMVRERVARAPRPVVWVTLGEASPGEALVTPDVAVEALRWDAGGSTFAVEVRRALPTLDGGEVAPQTIPVVLPVLGLQQVANAAMAVTLALMAGATASGVTEALADAEPMRRRMEIVRAAAPLVLDDTAGNPETLRAVFASAAAFPRRTLRVAFGVRGKRGPVINRHLAEALGELVTERAADGPVRLVVTASEDTADARNRVADEEREAALGHAARRRRAVRVRAAARRRARPPARRRRAGRRGAAARRAGDGSGGAAAAASGWRPPVLTAFPAAGSSRAA